jgi:ADP-ribosylation factor protein 1
MKILYSRWDLNPQPTRYKHAELTKLFYSSEILFTRITYFTIRVSFLQKNISLKYLTILNFIYFNKIEMGISFGKFSLFKNLFRKSIHSKILMLGLDNAGKTTLLYKLKLHTLVTTIPTLGFNVESVQHKNLNLTIWDVGGQERIRRLWEYYYHNSNALIFVVDSADLERFDESRNELLGILNHEDMTHKPLLLFANKQDLDEADSTEQITIKFGLGLIKTRKWYVQGCCAKTGDGIYEGLEWLYNQLS